MPPFGVGSSASSLTKSAKVLQLIYPFPIFPHRISCSISCNHDAIMAVDESADFLLRRCEDLPGLAQMRTAQIPGRGTAGGGPTNARAA